MKKFLALIILVFLGLSGCATGKFLGFLATNDYVDAKTKALADQQAAEIESSRARSRRTPRRSTRRRRRWTR